MSLQKIMYYKDNRRIILRLDTQYLFTKKKRQREGESNQTYEEARIAEEHSRGEKQV